MSALPSLLASRDELHLIERSSTAAATRSLLQAIAVIARAGARNRSVAEATSVLAGREQDGALRAVVGFVTRVQDPAMTNVAGWAQELVPEVISEVLDLAAQEGSTVARLPLTRVDLADGTAKIPMRTSRGLGATFRGEGQPIRIGGLSLTSAVLEGRSLGVIATASSEAITAASDAMLQRMIRIGMIADTAFALDAAFFDDVPRDAIRPEGLQYGIDPADTAVSSGTTLEALTTDMSARLKQLHARGLGGVKSSVVWAMHADRETALMGLSDELRLRGTFLGVPVLSSLAVPSDVIFLIDGRGIGFASDVPSFESASEVTLHEDDGAPNTDHKTGASVLPIASGVSGAGAISAAPTRSVFQTNCTAVRGVWEIDWSVLQQGAVQTITGVAL